MLTDVPTQQLENLLAAARAGRVVYPLSRLGLDRIGARALTAHQPLLAAFDQATLPPLLDAVLSERKSRPPTPELVWTGPEGAAATARSTEVVFRRLLASAERDVWMAGYSIDHGAQLFLPLYEAMQQRGVKARFLLHPQYAKNERRQPTVAAGADLIINRFLEKNWPFGRPEPDVYYDPRPLERRPRASMHIKAVVVDEARVLIGSANFTNAGQHRNYEAGAYLEDAAFARRLVTQLQSLIDARHVHRHGDASPGARA